MMVKKKLLEFENHHLMSIHFLPQHPVSKKQSGFCPKSNAISAVRIWRMARAPRTSWFGGHPAAPRRLSILMFFFFFGTIYIHPLLCIFGTIMYYYINIIYIYIHDQFRFQKLNVFLWKLSNFGIVVLFPDLVSWIGKSARWRNYTNSVNVS